MSGLIFVNKTNESENLGTDFYNDKLEKVNTVPISIIMDIYLQVVRILGMEWKRKKLLMKDAVYK